MFIWDFITENILNEIIDWVYAQIIGFLGNFFAEMGNMGAELFSLPWVSNIVSFFSSLAWALYGTGLVVACFECGIEYPCGFSIRGTMRQKQPMPRDALTGSKSDRRLHKKNEHGFCFRITAEYTDCKTAQRPARNILPPGVVNCFITLQPLSPSAK